MDQGTKMITTAALSQTDGYLAHPAAEIFPLLEGADFTALVEDIRVCGMLEPIVLYDGMILDGRNRWRACREAGVAPDTVQLPDGVEPFAFVVSKNLHRRHLSANQRAMIAARIANITSAGRPSNSSKMNDISLQEAASMVGVGRVYVSHARTIIEHGTPDEIAEAETNTSSVATIANRVRKRRKEAIKDAPNVVQLRPSSGGHPPGVSLPEGETVESIGRKAIELRGGGKSIQATAKTLGIGWQVCKLIEDVVLLAGRDDLPPREAEIATQALHDLTNRTRAVETIETSIKPIIERLWGNQRSSASRAEQEAARIDRFEHALGVMLQACKNTARIEVPHLSYEKAKDTLAEIEQALSSVRVLIAKIRRIHQ